MSYISKNNMSRVVQKIKDDYAQKEGVYEDLTAGNLVNPNASPTTREFTTMSPLKSGVSPDIEDGTATIKQILGSTVTHNQLVSDYAQNLETSSNGKIKVSDAYVTPGATEGKEAAIKGTFYGKSIVMNQFVTDGNVELSGTGQLAFGGGATFPQSIILNHKYFFTVKVKGVAGSTMRIRPIHNGNTSSYFVDATLTTSYVTYCDIFQAGSNDVGTADFLIIPLESSGTSYAQYGMVMDLTLMFGSGNEPSTVSELKVLLPNDYYEYDAGTIKNNNNTWTTGVWNQMVQNGNFASTSNWGVIGGASFSVSNNIGTITAVSQYGGLQNPMGVSQVIGHKYFITWTIKPTSNLSSNQATLVWNNGIREIGLLNYSYTANVWTTSSTIITSQEVGTSSNLYIYDNRSSGWDAIQIKNVMLIDLTLVYGAGNEPAETSTVLSDMSNWGYDLTTYQAYNAGEDVGGEVNLTNLNLRSAGSVKDEFDCIAESNNLIRRVGSVNLGGDSISWNKIGDGNKYWFTANLPTAISTYNVVPNLICSKYITQTPYHIYQNSAIGITSGTSGYWGNNKIAVYDSTYASYTADQFKSAMSGVYLVYELATPTTDTVTKQLITLKTGVNSLYEKTLSTTNFYNTDASLTYKGTSYDIKLINGHKYFFRDNGVDQALIDGSSTKTTQAVIGGEDILIDLTKEFGSGVVPTSLEGLYTYYPLYGKSIEYNAGQLVNYVGTGIKTVGFNLLNLAIRTVEKSSTIDPPATYDVGDTIFYKGFSSDGYGRPQTISSYSITDNSITVTTSSLSYASAYGIGIPCTVLPSTKYYFYSTSAGSSGRCVGVTFLDANQNILSYTGGLPYTYYGSFTTPYNCAYAVLDFKPGAASGTATFSNICLHVVDSSNDNDVANQVYEAYWERTLNFPTITAIQKHATTVYVRPGATTFMQEWLSLTDGGEALTPAANTAYKVASQGTYYGKVYFWNTSTSVYDEDTDNSRNLLFPDGLCSAGSVHDEITNSYAIKRVGIINLADLTGWYKYSNRWYASLSGATAKDTHTNYSTLVDNATCSRYTSSTSIWSVSSTENNVFGINGNSIYIRDSSVTTASEITGYITYELATPIKVTFDNDSTTGSANITSNLDLSYRVAKQGLEQSLPVVSTIVPTCSPFYGSVSYGADYVATIDAIPANYANKAALDTLLQLLGKSSTIETYITSTGALSFRTKS